MDFLEQKILDFITKKSGVNLEEIKREIIKDESDNLEVEKYLDHLEEKGLIYKGKNNNYVTLSTKSGIVLGKIILSNGNVSVVSQDGYHILIPKYENAGLLNGDTVLVSGIFENNNELCGTIKKIVKRKREQISCEVITENGKNKLVVYNGKNKMYIRIDQKELDKYGVGEILLIRLFTKVNNGYDGEYVKTIGHVNEPDVDEKTIIYDYGFETEFSPKTLKELDKIPTFVDAKKHIKEGRKDLREKMLFTIDGYDTKDIDDSIGLEILPNGNYKLYVNIADVSYYVKEGTALYEDAFKRGTSVYTNETVNHMLPPKISNGICSLHPNVDRLTKTCEMIISPTGSVVDYEIYDSIINSKKKMTYEDVNKILIDNEMVSGYEPFYDTLKKMNELSKILELAKVKRGYINFKKIEMKACGKGSNITFKTKTQRDGEKIIENFMLIANETIAQHVFYRALPFIYRVHETPNEDAIKDFLSMLNELGFKFKNCKNITSNKFLQDLTEMLEQETENFEVLSELLLINTMKKAKYSNINVGHFGLALSHYTHFTSPIRRFADLQVHKLLDMYKNYYEADYSNLEDFLSYVARHCSNRSYQAEKAEREAKKMRVAEYLSHNIGKKYKGSITYVTQGFLSVKTEEGFSGDIDTKDLLGDKFKYYAKKNCLVGIDTGLIYTIGTPIEVTVKSASKKNRMVRFDNGIPLTKEINVADLKKVMTKKTHKVHK